MKIIIEAETAEMEEIKSAVIKQLLTEWRDLLGTVSPSQLSGLFDMTPKAINDLGLDKVDLLENGRTIRYRVKDISALLEKRTIRGKATTSP